MLQKYQTQVLLKRFIVSVVFFALLLGSFVFMLQFKKLPIYFFVATSLLVFRLQSSHFTRISRFVTLLWLAVLVFMSLAEFSQWILDTWHPNDGLVLDESHNAQRVMATNFIWSYLIALVLTIFTIHFYRKNRKQYDTEENLLVLASLLLAVLVLVLKFF